MKTYYNLIFLLLLTTGLSTALAGCGPGFAWHRSNMTLYGPTPILEKPSIEKLELKELMRFGTQSSTPIEDWDAAFNAFENHLKSINNDKEGKRLRNQVQDRIVAASNQRCGEYKNFLKQFDSETNTILGGLATAIGGAGAIFTPANTARALSGIAAIFSGWRAEVNADFFNNLTIQVITKGIEARRKEILEQILKDRDNDLVTYSVQRAVGDAATYHYNCSLIAGLEYAGQSIDRVESPGLTNINKTLDNLIETQKKVATLIPKPPEKSDTPPKAPEKKDTPAGPPEKKDTPAKP